MLAPIHPAFCSDDPPRSVAATLKSLRVRANLTQDQAALVSGVLRRQIQRYEAGAVRPPIEVMPKLLGAYGVLWGEFLRLVRGDDGAGLRARLSVSRLPRLDAVDYVGLLRSQGVDCTLYNLDSGEALVVAAVLAEEPPPAVSASGG